MKQPTIKDFCANQDSFAGSCTVILLAEAGIKKKGLHWLRHTFASSLVNGIKQEDGSIKSLTPRQVADLLGHSTSQITELYYLKKRHLSAERNHK